jgi:Flp pilus assembly pilin Flp
MRTLLRKVWSDLEGLEVAEYAVMLGALLVLLAGLMRVL